MKAGDAYSEPVSPFNTPAVMKARALFVLQFFALLGCLGCAEAAIAEQGWRLMVPSALCFTLMVLIQVFLRRSGQWKICVDGLNQSYVRGYPPPDHEEASERLLELIDRRDEIERLRGTAGFDPWALQQVRHEIAGLLKEHPALAVMDEA